MRRRITSLLAVLALLCALLPQFALPVRAEDVSGACGDNLTWVLDRDTGELTVSGSGRMANGWYNDGTHQIEDIPWYPYLDEIVTVTICHGVTSIGDMAFRNCTSLTGLSIAGSVTSIGGEAFYGCTALEEISIPYGVTSIGIAAFSGCSGLLEPQLNLPDSVTTIGDYAFQDCNLEFASIPSSVTSIGYDAFCCYDLWWVEIYNPECAIDSSSGTLPVVQAIIGYPGSTAEAYAEANLLTFNAFGDYLKTFEEGLTWYLDCSTGVLTITPTNPNNWMTVRPYELSAWNDYLSTITSVQIGDGITGIAEQAFYHLDKLKTVTVPDSVTSIGYRAFADSGVTDVTILNPECEILDNSTTLRYKDYVTVRGYTGSTAQTYAEKYGYTFVPLDAPEETVVSGECGENVSWSLDRETGMLTVSGSGAMEDYILTRGGSDPAPWSAYASEITSVVIEDGVTAIGENAFAGCENLASVTIPDSVTSIGENAFSGTALTELTVPNPACDLPDSLGLPANATITGYPGSTAQAYAEANGYTFEAVAGTPAEPWYFNEDTGLLVICSDEAMEGWSSSNRPPWYDFRAEILKVSILDGVTIIVSQSFQHCSNVTIITIPDGVTSIGGGALYGCTSLTSVTIPDSVTSIGDYAFYNCTGLTNMTIPGSVASIGDFAFRGCTSLTEITLLDGVTSIGINAFGNCTSLTNVTIPDSVTSIGARAFSDCTSLTNVTIPDGVTSLEYDAFLGCSSLLSYEVGAGNNCYCSVDGILFNKDKTILIAYPCAKAGSYEIPDSVTIIGNYAFWGCTGLTSVTIPGSVTSIGSFAFYSCSGLTSVTIPDSVTSIDGSTFYGCTDLTSVTIPDSVTSIGSYAFDDCRSLTSVIIPDGVTSIGIGTFSGCTSLSSVTIPDSVTSIGGFAFCGCTSLTSVTIPDGVTGIGDSTFYGCSSLTSVTIPNSVTSIGGSAFRGCTSLTSVSLPDSVTIIDRFVFAECSSLTSVTIPDSVTIIDRFSFLSCTSLTSVTIPDSVTYIGLYAFNGCICLTELTILNPTCDFYSYSDTLANASTTTLRGYSGSTTQAYAEAYGYTFVPLDAEPWFFIADTGLLVICSDEVMQNWNIFNRPPWYDFRNDILKVLILDGVTKIGNAAFFDCTSLMGVTIPDSVLSIGLSAFYGCTSLTSVTIPDGVTSIGSYAFYNCASLTSVTIPDSVTNIGVSTFYGCTSLTSVTIPEGVTSIGDSTFYGCASLTNVMIPDTVLNIASSAFYGCTSLTSLTIPDGVTSIGMYTFYNCTSLTSVSIPDSVMSIGRYAFDNCTSLASVTIPDGVTSIDMYTFYNCTSLASVTIPDSVVSIGNSAFYNCSSLTNVTIPDGVTSIDYATFFNCSSLTSVTIPNSVASISRYAFNTCSSLKEIIIPDSVTTIDSAAFSGCSSLKSVTILNPECNIYASNVTLSSASETTIYGYANSTAEAYAVQYGYTFLDLEAPAIASGTCGESLTWMLDRDTGVLTISGSGAMDNWKSKLLPPWYDYRVEIETVTILDNATSIGVDAFCNCSNLISVTIPDSVTSIGNSAFYNCTSLTNVVIPDGVTHIGSSAFQDCTSLTSVVIPDSVTIIGGQAFLQCSSLTSVTIPDSVTSIGLYTFNSCTSLSSIHVGSDNSFYYSIDGVLFEKNSSKLIRYPAGRSGAYQIPDGVTSIAKYAFEGCNGLTDVTIPDGVTSIDSWAFFYCSNLLSVAIPDSVTSIGYDAFYYCASLTSVSIPDSVTSIGNQAFSRCTSLTNVTIPDSVTSIGGSMFYGCTSLTSVTIPDNVVSIGALAFADCSNLKNVTVLNPECGFYAQIDTLGDPSATTIYGYIGSTAHSYAEQYGYSFVPLDGYLLHFDANGGDGVMGDLMIAYDTNANLTANAFSRTGYSFNGWNTAADGSGTSHGDGASVYNLTSETEITLYAQWKAKTYLVHYYANGGEGVALENQRATYDAPFVLRENTFIRTGYTAAGWNTAADGSGTAYESSQLAANLTDAAAVTLYAQFAPNTYDIVFNANGGEGEMADQQMTYGVYSALTQNAFTRTGFTFDGWNTARDGSGTAYPDKRTVRNLATEGTVTLYAQWKPNNYTILLVANGGEGDAVTVRATYNLPVALPANTFTRTAYKFAGWNTAADGSGTPFTDRQTVRNLASGGTVKLYAQWKPNAYTIMFVTNGGSGSTVSQKTFYDLPTALEPNTFTKTGYSFAKWNTAYDGSGTSYSDGQTVKNLVVSGTFKLYAQWKANKYTVTFDANGGTGTMIDQTMTYNTSAALRANTYTKTGYTFTGWNTAADGSGTSYTNGKTVRNLATEGTVTLYAQWTPNTITVRFYPGGGVGSMDNQVMTYDVPAALNVNNFSKDGYTFAGWKTGAGVIYTDGQVVENLALKGVVNLYAQWTR